MKTSRPVQILTVAFALSMLTAYVVYSQRQQTRTVAPGSKSRVLDPSKAQLMRAERDSAPSQKPLTVAPGSKGGLVQLGETTPRVTVATTNHTSDRASSFVASSSKSISPLIRIQPDGPIWSSITSAPAASNGTQVRIFDLGLSSAPPAPSGKSARVLPGSKSATVFAPEEVQSLIRATNWLAPAAPAAKKTNSVAKPKSQP